MDFEPNATRKDWRASSPFASKAVEELIAENDERERLRANEEGRKVAAWRAEPGCEDYRVFRFDVGLEARDVADECCAIDGSYDFSQLDDHAMIDAAKGELGPLFMPLLTYFASTGCVRGDGTREGFAGTIPAMPHEDDHLPTFYLIARLDGDADLDPGVLLPGPILSATPTFAAVTLQPHCAPDGSLTGLFEQLRARQPDASIGQWGGKGTPELLPVATESLKDWLNRVAMPAKQLRRTIARWERSKSIELFQMCGSGTERVGGGRAIGWAVPGLIPTGGVTLLAGAQMTGKSTLASELAAVLDSESEKPRYFLGVEITARLVVAMVSGEDPASFFDARAKYYEQEHGQSKGFLIDGTTKSFDECLEALHTIPELGLVIFDPVRAFLDGDEDSSYRASQFFKRLSGLSVEKGCAVVVVHHLKKGSSPRSLKQLRDMVRGSGVFLDRPRMSIGILSRGNFISGIGIIKHNFPASERLWGALFEERRFRHDVDTARLVPHDGLPERPTNNGAPIEDITDRIFQAFASQCANGKTVRPTGRYELFELKLPELAGLSRGAIRAVVARLIADGRIVNGDDGLKVGTNPGGCKPTNLT